MIELSYLNINDSHQNNGNKQVLKRSWDGLLVTPSLKLKDMNLETLNRIKELTKVLDQPLYNMALEKFNQQVFICVFICTIVHVFL